MLLLKSPGQSFFEVIVFSSGNGLERACSSVVTWGV